MYKNSDIFITSFNRIEKYIKSMLKNNKNGVGFAKAVKILRKYNAIINRYSDDLLEFAELRNAIVHNRVDVTYIIAEPHDSVVKKIKQIERDLFEPRTVASLFSREVHRFEETDMLENLLSVICEKGYTKFPIYDGKKFKGIITQKGITNWLAHRMRNDSMVSMETQLREVLPYEEKGNYQFIAANDSVYDAEEIFKEQIGKGTRLEALLITKNGKPDEWLTGIITNWDIMNIKE